jgi:hypothetical protein
VSRGRTGKGNGALRRAIAKKAPPMGVFLRSNTARARKLPCQGFETGFSELDAVGFLALATDADCALAAYGEETFID